MNISRKVRSCQGVYLGALMSFLLVLWRSLKVVFSGKCNLDFCVDVALSVLGSSRRAELEAGGTELLIHHRRSSSRG